jgi:hypothetical protein
MARPTSLSTDDPRIAGAPRELDSRVSDGIQVQLLWHPHDGHISVAVNDSKTGETLELSVHQGRHALDVFHHPYAYAAEPRTASVSQRSPLTGGHGRVKTRCRRPGIASDTCASLARPARRPRHKEAGAEPAAAGLPGDAGPELVGRMLTGLHEVLPRMNSP